MTVYFVYTGKSGFHKTLTKNYHSKNIPTAELTLSYDVKALKNIATARFARNAIKKFGVKSK